MSKIYLVRRDLKKIEGGRIEYTDYDREKLVLRVAGVDLVVEGEFKVSVKGVL